MRFLRFLRRLLTSRPAGRAAALTLLTVAQVIAFALSLFATVYNLPLRADLGNLSDALRGIRFFVDYVWPQRRPKSEQQRELEHDEDVA